MKYVKLLSKISVGESLIFLVLGISFMVDENYFIGIVFIALGLSLSIQDLINIFNKKKKK